MVVAFASLGKGLSLKKGAISQSPVVCVDGPLSIPNLRAGKFWEASPSEGDACSACGLPQKLRGPHRIATYGWQVVWL